MEEKVLLEVSGVSKSYGDKVAVKDINFSVQKGHIFGLLGPNGAGKTSLIRMINGIISQDEGRISLNGEEHPEKRQRMIGYLPEERGLYPKMKVGEQLLYLSQLKGLDKKKANVRLKELFEQFGASEWWDLKVESLSKGMAQKLQFIATIVHKPPMLILDEPFTGFDPVNTQKIVDHLLHLKAQGTSILLSTHRMESVEALCDEVAFIHRSEKILSGKLMDIKQQYKKGLFECKIASTNFPPSLAHPAYECLSQEESDGVIALRLKIHGSSNEILQDLMQYGDLCYFEEILPKMNEIFIDLAAEKTTNETKQEKA